MLTLASSGNLSITQSVLSLLNEGFTHPDTGETLLLSKCQTMFQAAQLVGRAVREVYRIDGPQKIARILAAPDIQRPNGIQISPDDRTLYLVEANGAPTERAIVSTGTSTGGLLEALGLVEPFMDPDAFHRIAIDGEAVATAPGPSRAAETRIGYRAVRLSDLGAGMLAMPETALDPVLERRQRDLAMLFLLATLAGLAVGALWLWIAGLRLPGRTVRTART